MHGQKRANERTIKKNTLAIVRDTTGMRSREITKKGKEEKESEKKIVKLKNAWKKKVKQGTVKKNTRANVRDATGMKSRETRKEKK